jgi:hypothetical protein
MVKAARPSFSKPDSRSTSRDNAVRCDSWEDTSDIVRFYFMLHYPHAARAHFEAYARAAWEAEADR